MTDQLTALRELAVKVKAGDMLNEHSMFRVFGGDWVHAYNASNGSLGAARSLHRDVLGDDWHWTVGFVILRDGYLATVYKDDFSIVEVATSSSDARALLLAIIKANITELEVEE